MKKPYIEDEWNSWTPKSNHLDFKSLEAAVGDGEHKLGAEYDQTPLGQNSAYDLDILGEKWEVKKIDDDNSFRLGIEVSAAYTPLIVKVSRILEKLVGLKGSLLDSKVGEEINNCIDKIEDNSGRSKTFLLDGLRKNEVSSSNLDKANDIIEVLKKIMLFEKNTITLYSSYDGNKQKYGLLDAFKKLTIEKTPIDEILKIFGDKDIYNTLHVATEILNDLKTFENISLRDELNNTVRNVFKKTKLVLVLEDKGYMPINNLNKIICNRITSGKPRCKFL